MKVIKKDLTSEDFNNSKIVNAIKSSSERVRVDLTEVKCNQVLECVSRLTKGLNEIKVGDLHNVVESALDEVQPDVARSYREYRNYKKDFVGMLDEVYQKAQKIMYLGDKDNSNTDSALVTSKRSLIYGELNKELYNKFFLTNEEKQACKEGYIYIHDKSARRDSINCCLYDTKTVMTGGFEMGNIWYNEPNSIDVACDVLGDIIMMSASMQYGGWSTRVDDLLAPYVEKSYKRYRTELINDILLSSPKGTEINESYIEESSLKKVRRELEQGVQGLEYKLNTVASSRGDYLFTTFALGLGKNRFEKMVSEVFLEVRMKGQGKSGNKKPVLFPKLIFLYDSKVHGEGKKMEDLFDLAISCSSKSMYPDFLSLDGDGYVPSVYKKTGKVIYPMGCFTVAHIKLL